MTEKTKTACVTGGTGFMASVLIQQLLAKGYAVNATVRDPDDLAKISHLKELQGLGTLKLFRADLGEEGSFDAAVDGCDYVFHVATPTNIMSDVDPENELIKPAIQGTLNVMKSCVKVKSVKRIVVTSSSASVSVNSLEGKGLVMDEDSWSDTEFLTTEKPPSWGYVLSKTLAEKEAYKFAEGKIDLVTIIPAMMLGTAPTLNTPLSIRMALSLLIGNEFDIGILKIMQEVSGSISVVHVEDACRAHIFAAETESASGRYICSAIDPSLPELAQFLSKRYTQYKVPTDFGNLSAIGKLSLSSEKLVKAGFEFKHPHLGEIYDEIVQYGKIFGLLPK